MNSLEVFVIIFDTFTFVVACPSKITKCLCSNKIETTFIVAEHFFYFNRIQIEVKC